MNTNEVSARTFGRWLKTQLDRREWTQADFARRLGVANGQVSNWIQGKRLPGPASIDNIADVLFIDVDTVLTMAGHRPATLPLDPDSATARLMPLIEQIDWESRPGRIEEMEAELRYMVDMDRKRRQIAQDRRQ